MTKSLESAVPTTPALLSRRWTEYDDKTAMQVNKILLKQAEIIEQKNINDDLSHVNALCSWKYVLKTIKDLYNVY